MAGWLRRSQRACTHAQVSSLNQRFSVAKRSFSGQVFVSSTYWRRTEPPSSQGAPVPAFRSRPSGRESFAPSKVPGPAAARNKCPRGATPEVLASRTSKKTIPPPPRTRRRRAGGVQYPWRGRWGRRGCSGCGEREKACCGVCGCGGACQGASFRRPVQVELGKGSVT